MMQLLQQGVLVQGSEMVLSAFMTFFYAQHGMHVHMRIVSKESLIALVRHWRGF